MNVNGVGYFMVRAMCGHVVQIHKRGVTDFTTPITEVPYHNEEGEHYEDVARAAITAIDAIEKARQSSKNVVKEELILSIA